MALERFITITPQVVPTFTPETFGDRISADLVWTAPSIQGAQYLVVGAVGPYLDPDYSSGASISYLCISKSSFDFYVSNGGGIFRPDVPSVDSKFGISNPLDVLLKNMSFDAGESLYISCLIFSPESSNAPIVPQNFTARITFLEIIPD